MHRRGYRFVAQTTGGPRRESRLEASITSPRSGTVLVGREAVVAKLLDACARAEQGDRQLVFVTGEPGVGKTTVVDEFLRIIGNRGCQRISDFMICGYRKSEKPRRGSLAAMG